MCVQAVDPQSTRFRATPRVPRRSWTAGNQSAVHFDHVENFCSRCYSSSPRRLSRKKARPPMSALRVVGTQLNRDAVNHVISVTGVDGTPQPANWKILVADQTRARWRARNGSRPTAASFPNARLCAPSSGRPKAPRSTLALNLDSSGAYAVASRTAEHRTRPFALASYTLRTDERGESDLDRHFGKSNRDGPSARFISARTRERSRARKECFRARHMEQVVMG